MPRRKAHRSHQEACVAKLAIYNAPLPGPSNVRTDLIERIKKLFDLANHSKSNENEVQAAIKMATMIMQKHNIHLSQIMQYEDAKEQAHRAGISEVNITKPHGSGDVRFETWTEELSAAICKFFDCNAFSTQHLLRIVWTFYGIAEHTVTAAVIFERMYALIVRGASELVGVATRNSYCCGAAGGLRRIAEREWVAAGAKARENEGRALASKIAEEDAARRREIDRLQPHVIAVPDLKQEGDEELRPPALGEQAGGAAGDAKFEGDGDVVMQNDNPDPVQDSGYEEEEDEESWNGFDDSDDDVVVLDVGIEQTKGQSHHDKTHRTADYDARDESAAIDADEGDFETTLQQFMNIPDPMPSQPETSTGAGDSTSRDGGDQPQWESAQQLTLFRQSAKNIGEAWLEENNIKLKRCKMRMSSIKDTEAYQQGRTDSKEINAQARRQRIEGK